ncbi:CDP-glucose 4,6-dehydratase [Megasphaera cerevisiae DSM 20462]|uniref:CDP-glucose 4,6-dehydratase n=1 Tax=Megasphaera cerevisiae DSM 20462 TaxID=1122219 RepID=A0A0J6WR90_9FIRM|nr:CDP-glucose 4,6-dehydratase [Megasphaera cerevisiae]KMO85975.1 CDP-glucose 4,6-dehydratase [Megasphaera cerevisiae DSM 20462]SKA13236.1 CDP-glucose 4,6-dehydratase [Megasphaera cerevisiae DSM 20462]
MRLHPEFYKGKNVFVTGHTGFKGTWLCKMLELFGANVTGYALSSPTSKGAEVFRVSGVEAGMHSVIGDIRDYQTLKKVFDKSKPEIVLHLAAQPIVIESYRDPHGTYETNVMGTVNVLECVRQSDSVKSFLNVTTDKVYKNNEWVWGYRENEPLDGYDPYSNSKSCSELVTHSYQKSFFSDDRVAISTARAGNVIGGGDFAPNRIVPDSIRAAYEGKCIEVRNPYSTRPYQYVLEPLYVYLMIAEAQYTEPKYSGWYNVGPDDCDCVTTGELTDLFCRIWSNGISWKDVSVEGPHEAGFLKLDCSKVKNTFDWKPHWHITKALEKTVEWAKAWRNHDNISDLMKKQIYEFMEE